MSYWGSIGESLGPVTTPDGCVQLFADEAMRLEKRLNQFAAEAGYQPVAVDGVIDITDADRVVRMLVTIFDNYQVTPIWPEGVDSIGAYLDRYKPTASCTAAQRFVDDHFGDIDKAEHFHDLANRIAAGKIKRRAGLSTTSLLTISALGLGAVWLWRKS